MTVDAGLNGRRGADGPGDQEQASRVWGSAQAALGLIRVAVADTAQPVEARCVLAEAIPAGAAVRLVGDSLRSATGGFQPERLSVVAGARGEAVAPATVDQASQSGAAHLGAAWPVQGGRLPRPAPLSGVDQGPRQVLLASCPGAARGATVAVAGTLRPGQPYAGVALVYRLEAASGFGGVPPPDEGAGWRAVSDWFGFVYTAGPADHLEAFVDAAGNVAAGLFDAWTNPVAADVDAVEVVQDGVTRRVPLPAVHSAPYAAVRLPLAHPPATGARVMVRDTLGRETVSSPAPPAATPEGERLLFGDFHWHTGASGDGTRPLDDAYGSARDGLLLDYAGAADHFPFDRGFPLREAADVADAFDRPGQFATLLGIELSWRMAHYNFYWADREELERFLAAWQARRPGPEAGTVFAPDLAAFYGLPPAYFELASPGRLLVIPHHPNTTSEQFVTQNGLPVWTHYHWPAGHYDRRIVRLGEIVQTRGCFETEEPDLDWKVRHGAGGGSLRTALAKGCRVGFTGGTDNHSGWPGRQTGGWVGLTAVYAPEHSRAGIMRALYNRRCYATTGARMVVDFRLNGAPMGSELQLLPLDERRLSIRAHGTAPLDRVEVVSQGAVIARLPCDGPDLVTQWVDERKTRPLHDAYYYLRVRQQDGHCAWTSPIWADLAIPPQGLSSYGGPVSWS